MKIAIGADHAGFSLKEQLRHTLAGEGYEVVDFGTGSPESCDYPDFAQSVGRDVAAAPRDSSTLSVRSWRTMRPRSAPRAVRMANSRLRAVERASSRLATLAQAMISTNPTAPASSSSVGWMLPTMSSFMETILPPAPAFVFGYWRARPLQMDAISACAASMLTPGLRRPMTTIPGRDSRVRSSTDRYCSIGT